MRTVDPDPQPERAAQEGHPDHGGTISPDPEPPVPAPTGERAPEALSRLRLASRALNQSPPVAQALEVLVYLALGLDDRVPLTDAASRGVPVWLHDLDELDRRYPQLLSLPDRAEASASLPLMVDDRCVGAFGIACDEPAHFAAEDRILLLTV